MEALTRSTDFRMVTFAPIVVLRNRTEKFET